MKTKTQMNARFSMKLFLMGIMLCCSLLVTAQTYKTHTVERGENLEFIAQKYNATVSELIELNPIAQHFVYVGMKLKVPVKSNSTKQKKQNESSTSVSEITEIEANEDVAGRKGDWKIAYEAGYGFLPKIEGSSGGHFAYHVTFGADYYVTDKFYTGGRLGYNSASYSWYKGSSDSHFITLPLELGYALETENRKFALIPYGGLTLNFCLSSKTKHDGEKYDNDITLGADVTFGVRLRVGEFNIGGAYHIPLNDDQKGAFGKDAYPAISIGCGF